MKKLFLAPFYAAAILTMASCSDDGRIKERPDGIVETGARAEIYQKIMAEFPEHQNVRSSRSELFDGSTSKQIVLSSESDVYVTFISEGASLSNTFGWYSYDANAKPSSPSALELHVLFPHVTDRVLKQGDRLKLGDKKFPAGTVVGFFLIIHGWENAAIHFDRETFYTDYEFNPNGQQQHVLFKQKELGDIVLTFEDVLTTMESDQDYNDIIFTVTDNTENKEVTSFNMTNVVEL